jgi:AmmeMemoRadiSam system protein B
MSRAEPTIRPPAVAGQFYPSEPVELEAMVRRQLDAASVLLGPAAGPDPHALVAPHAGFVYSGPIAASAYARIRGRRDEITRVVLLGPAHRVALRGMAVPSSDGFATPLGVVTIDAALPTIALERADVVVDDRPHADEHSLEVHLPFLQVALGGGWTLLPVVVGLVGPEAVAELLHAVWGGRETLVVVSSDLSHYHDHDTAERLDAATAADIVARRWPALESERACGAAPLRGLLAEADRRDLPVALLDLRNSGDTAGDHRRVVGYGAFAVG